MDVKLTAWHASATCSWCEKDREAVTVDFADGFLRQAPLCWSCLQKAIKVRNRQAGAPPTPAPHAKS
jgi:hypothetical protein